MPESPRHAIQSHSQCHIGNFDVIRLLSTLCCLYMAKERSQNTSRATDHSCIAINNRRNKFRRNPSILEKLIGIIGILSVLVSAMYKVLSLKLIFMANPCHLYVVGHQ